MQDQSSTFESGLLPLGSLNQYVEYVHLEADFEFLSTVGLS